MQRRAAYNFLSVHMVVGLEIAYAPIAESIAELKSMPTSKRKAKTVHSTASCFFSADVLIVFSFVCLDAHCVHMIRIGSYGQNFRDKKTLDGQGEWEKLEGKIKARIVSDPGK